MHTPARQARKQDRRAGQDRMVCVWGSVAGFPKHLTGLRHAAAGGCLGRATCRLSGTSSNIGHAAIATTPLHDGVCIYHCLHVSAVWCLQQLVLPSPTMARRQHHTAMPGGAPPTGTHALSRIYVACVITVINTAMVECYPWQQRSADAAVCRELVGIMDRVVVPA